MFISIRNQSRYFVQTISITPSYASVCIGSAPQSRTSFFHFERSTIDLLSRPCAATRVLVSSAANPAFSAEELQYQLEATKAKLLFVHPSALQAGLAAARATGLSDDKVVLIEPALNAKQHFVTLDEVILEGLKHPKPFVDRKLKPGEAKTKIAVSIGPIHYLKVV